MYFLSKLWTLGTISLKEELASDVLIASDGPRLTAGQPTVFLGSRGIVDFDLHVELREGGQFPELGQVQFDTPGDLFHRLDLGGGPNA